MFSMIGLRIGFRNVFSIIWLIWLIELGYELDRFRVRVRVRVKLEDLIL